MDTKLKNIKYSIVTKSVAVIIIWLCSLGIYGTITYLGNNQEFYTTKSYFETRSMNYEFQRLVYNAIELNVKLVSEDNINKSEKTEEEKSVDLTQFHIIKNRLKNTVNFKYYIVNIDTGKTYTNFHEDNPIKKLRNQTAFVHYTQLGRHDDNNYHRYLYSNDITKMLKGTNYEVYASVMEPLEEGDLFYEGFESYERMNTKYKYIILLFLALLIIIIICLIYLVVVCGSTSEKGSISLNLIDKIYVDVHTVFILFLIGISLLGVLGTINYYDLKYLVITIIMYNLSVFLVISYILSFARQYKNGYILKNTFIYNLLAKYKLYIKEYLNGKVLKVFTVFSLLVYGFINGILMAITISLIMDNYRYGYYMFMDVRVLISSIILLVFNLVYIYYITKPFMSLSRIMRGVEEISKGNLEYDLKDSEVSTVFSSFIHDIKKIQGGLKEAVDDAIRGERMKTELITNVSHDLKTPLTSIVNYVDLLKKENLSNKKAEGYVKVLEDKSARLKQLIEDLIEASKASSGNLEVQLEKVNLQELVMQACGEYEEKISKCNLDVRTNFCDETVNVKADGKYMWRIIENLLSNVIKYSMGNSRVYINITKDNGEGVIIIKNISAFPLDIEPEQLAERFVRGDKSRTTEGSGLGLSIAQSLTHLQGGFFKVEIDGDLFKVSVKIPLYNKD
ncbi:UNVERIFIED_CONTAM: signal transduction histidine kinase [Acetivibrio alkalicellulosi]